MLYNASLPGWSRSRAPAGLTVMLMAALSCHGSTAVKRDEPAPSGASPVLKLGPRQITVGGDVALHVDVAGSGPPCLYVHGGPGQGVQSFQRMRGDALQSFLTMIYVDQRGSGQSDNADDYRLERVVDDLEEVRRALGFDKIYVLSHSFGGLIAFRYVEKYPDRVLGLILANSTIWFPAAVRSQLAFMREQVGDRMRTPDDAPWEVLNLDYERVRQKLRAKSEYVKLLAEDMQTMRTLNQVDSDPPRKSELGAYVIHDARARSDYDVDFSPRTASVQAPVLIITGDRDHAIGPEHYRLFHFPHQTVQHIDGSHLLYYENSAEFVAAIRGWITAATSAGAIEPKH